MNMTNAQAALLAATTRWSGIGGPVSTIAGAVTTEAEKYLTWLDQQDAGRVSEPPTPWPVRLASPEVAVRYAGVGGDDDEEVGPADRGLPR